MAGKKKGAKRQEENKPPKSTAAASAAGQKKTGALLGGDSDAARKTASASLMAVVEARPLHEVHLADVRQTKRLAELAVPQLEKLEWSARMDKPDDEDRYRVASALARAGAIGIFFEHSDWISKEYASNPYICTPPPDSQSPYPNRSVACNPSGVSYSAINHLLEILHLGGRLPFARITQIGGPVLETRVSRPAPPTTRHTHLAGGPSRRFHTLALRILYNMMRSHRTPFVFLPAAARREEPTPGLPQRDISLQSVS